MNNFDFTKAQTHELGWQTEYIKTVLPPEYLAWKDNKNVPVLCSWLPPALRDEFLRDVNGKVGMDIGCGSIPMLRHSHGLGERIAIDPLALHYKHIQSKLWGGSFFDDLLVVNMKIEDFLPSYVGHADGLIVFRNALDHLEDPLLALRNISLYAHRGCYLFFWSDIWHLLGTDSGHRNITRSKDAIDALLRGLGFECIATIPSQHDNDNYIEFGGVFRKL